MSQGADTNTRRGVRSRAEATVAPPPRSLYTSRPPDSRLRASRSSGQRRYGVTTSGQIC
jgi:hypothetical protein